MNRIDKLILQARQAAAPGLELVLAMVEHNGNAWTAVVHLHDGGAGRLPHIQRATWSTLAQAVEHISKAAEKYPNSQDVPIIIDDMG